jgi:hypothetical protein
MTTLRLMAIDAICQRGSIRDSDVAALRRAFALETQFAASDIDGLFRAHNLARVRDQSWSDFFIEALTDYVVRELEPSGYVTAAHAGWLIARVSSAGRIRSKTEQDLLLNVIDKARWVPESLMTFAIGQIRDAVRSGDGPLRAGSGIGAGAITLTEVEQVRSLLFAYGNEGQRSITQSEIDLLLDIEEAIAEREASTQHPECFTSPIEGWPLESWRDLLQKSVANAVLSASGYEGPSREEALNEARALFEVQPYPTHYRAGRESRRLSAELTSQGGIVSTYRQLAPEARALLRLELQRIEIITGEPVHVADPVRLAMRLMAPSLLDSPAFRLLDELAAQGLCLAPAFGGPATGDAVYAA